MPRADPSPVCWAGEPSERAGEIRDTSGVELQGPKYLRGASRKPSRMSPPIHSLGSRVLRTRLPALPGSCAREARGYAEEKPSPTSVVPKSCHHPETLS